MVAAYLRIAPLASASAADPEVIRDLIYANATPEDRVEHIRVRIDSRGADIFAFIDVEDPQEAADSLQHLVTKTIAGSPRLRLWRVV